MIEIRPVRIGQRAAKCPGLRIQHSDDRRAFLYHDPLRLLVTADRHVLFFRSFRLVDFFDQPEPASRGGFGRAFWQRRPCQGRDTLRIELPQVRRNRVIITGPAWKDHVHRDAVRQAEDVPRQRHPVAPGAVQRHDQVVAVGLGRKVGILPQNMAETADPAHELAACAPHGGVGLGFLDRDVNFGIFRSGHVSHVFSNWIGENGRHAPIPGVRRTASPAQAVMQDDRNGEFFLVAQMPGQKGFDCLSDTMHLPRFVASLFFV